MAARADIIRDIRDTLETISVANGYSTDVAHVEIGIRTWTEVPQSQRPYIGIAPEQEASYDRVVNGVYDVVMPIAIAVHVDGPDAEDRLDALDQIEDDILTALRVDPRRGGAATATHPVGLGTDEAEPAKLPHGTGLFRWVVEYQRDDEATPSEERVNYADISVEIGAQAAASIAAAWDGSVPISNFVVAEGTWSPQNLALVGFDQPVAGEAILRYVGTRRRLFRATASMLPTGSGIPCAGIATRPNSGGSWTVHPQTVRQGGTDSTYGQVLLSLSPNAEVAVFVGNLLNVADVTFFGGLVLTEI